MYVYAGIDEAGYGPMFGPLLVGRMVLGMPHLPSAGDADADALAPWTGKQLWKRLSGAVCHDLTKRNGRIAVNDSKKLKTAKKSGDADHHPLKYIEHLERGVLAFAALAGHRPADVNQWLNCLGENCHHDLSHLPWYAPSERNPWGALPGACTEGEIAVARNMLAATAQKTGLQVLDMGAAVVFEDRFNRMVAATRSKASTSFTFVAGHLRAIWDQHGQHHPNVVVDRQSGRTHYRELLAMSFPEAELAILDETPERSAYRIEEKVRQKSHQANKPTSQQGEDADKSDSSSSLDGSMASSLVGSSSPRSMTISFEVDSESQHMPVALASMISKYTRELMMARFQSWFQHHAPQIKPTAGYALDARRFWEEIQPVLPSLDIDPRHLARTR